MSYFRRKGLLFYIKSDVRLTTEDYWDIDRKNKIDGFKFFTKSPLSKMYRWHGTIGLEHTYGVLKLIQEGIKNKSKYVSITIHSGLGTETVKLWKGSLKSAESQMMDMIKEIQNQY